MNDLEQLPELVLCEKVDDALFSPTGGTYRFCGFLWPSHIQHYSTYGDNLETPVHYGHQAVTTWRFSVWIVLSLPSISLHSLTSVCRINNASCVPLPDLQPVSMPTRR